MEGPRAEAGNPVRSSDERRWWLGQGGSNENGKKWTETRYILKAEQTEFALEMDVGMWGI